MHEDQLGMKALQMPILTALVAKEGDKSYTTPNAKPLSEKRIYIMS